jgi:EAL domain-containing protein (putative c-di-GMP-specific phosphodiesterase class I)
VAAGLVRRLELPAVLARELATRAGDGRSVGLLAVRVGIEGDAPFGFEPALEDAIDAGVTASLRAVLREVDCVAPIGGNEFLVMLPQAHGVAQAELAALRVLRLFEEPQRLLGEPRQLRARVGVASAPEHGHEASALVRAARLAAHIAASRETSYCVCEVQADRDEAEIARLEPELRAALRDNALTLHYQPQVELASGRAVSAEALARWVGRDGLAVSPGVFVPIAENRGLMPSFTRWTLNAGLRQLARFRAAGLDTGLSINISPANLDEPDFPELVAQSLAVWSVPASDLTLELTESIPLGNPDKALPMLHRLKDVGVRLAIDDFGTGYSSLSLLRKLPVDDLKIDQQFVRGMLLSEPSMQIVRAVLDLANNFGLKSVAEGVEDDATLDALRALDCTLGQGYAIARPMTDSALIDWFLAR